MQQRRRTSRSQYLGRLFGRYQVDGVYYVVEGEELNIDAIKVTPKSGYKAATLGATSYYWNYQFLGTTIVEPFGITVDTEGMEPGDYIMQIRSTVYQVDRAAGIAYIVLPVKIVADDDGVPGNGDEPEEGTINPDSDIRAAVAPTD
jgi:hypothetical protein